MSCDKYVMQDEKYTKIKFYRYYYMNNDGPKFTYGKNKNKWIEHDIDLDDNIYAIKLMGKPKYQFNNQLITQDILLSDNTTKTHVLVDKRNSNKKMKDYISTIPQNFTIDNIIRYVYHVSLK